MSKKSSASNRPRRTSSRYVTTRSGKVLKINRNMGERWVAMKEAKSRRRVERMKGLPKSRLKRLAWRLNPKRQAAYWFSRDGGIMALKITGVGILVLFIVALAVFSYFRKDLPNVTDISGGNLGGSISYFDRTGQTLLWQDYNGVKRVPVSGDNISNYVKEATVATEDRNFYNERGFDIKGIVRSAYVDILHRGGTQGGSTITEQLVKLTQDFGQTRSLSLKAKELILAVELERTYSKDQILTGYLNSAPYGSVDYGVQAAASDYFHKSAKDLTLAEAAMLATIPKSPAFYSPYDSETFDKAAFVGRYEYVLDSMVVTGKITKAQATAAKKVDILAEVQPQQTKYAGIKAPYFVLAAKEQLTQLAGSGSSAGSKKVGGWKVITTLDANLQSESENLVASNLSYIERYNADEEAQVGEDVQTGQIVSLVGGVDFTNPAYGQNNYAAGILIPPGSSFKPYDYSTLINDNSNVGAGSVLYDTQGPLPGYPCTNNAAQSHGGNCLQDYDFLQPGPITVRYAIGGSRNIPAVKSMLESKPGDTSTDRAASVNNVVDTATAMMDNTYDNEHGLKTYNCYDDVALTHTTQCYGASAIGDGAYLYLDDHVNGLSTLARLGQAIPRTFLLNVTNSDNKVIYQWKQPKPTQAIKPDTAYILNSIASDPNASYLPGSCTAITCAPLSRGGYKFQRYNGWDFAVKTGTTNNGFDGLMTSWSTKYAVVSWVGNHTRNVALGIDMEYLTEPLTRGWMEYAHQNLKPVTWTEPSDMKTLPAFVVRNHIHYGDIEPSPSTDLFPSWYTGNSSGSSTSATIDKVSNKLATSCTPALAKDTQANANAAGWNADMFHGGSPSVGSGSSGISSGGSDDVHSCSDNPPTIDSFYINGEDATNPNNLPINCSGSCTVTSTVSAGTHPFNDPTYAQFPGTINLLVNGQVVQSQSVADPSDTKSFTYNGSGSATIAIQVVDSVLYSTTSGNATVNFTVAAQPLTFQSAKATGPNTTINWSGGSGTVTVKKGGTTICSAPASAGTCSGTGAAKNSAITLTDDNSTVSGIVG